MTKSSNAAGIFVALFLFLLPASSTAGIRAKRYDAEAEQRHELDLADAKSILIFGSGGTVEILNASVPLSTNTIASQIIQQHEELNKNNELNADKTLLFVSVTPVRKLTIDPAQKGLIILLDGSRKSFYVNSGGEITNGPETTISKTDNAGVTSLPGVNGELRPMFCHGGPLGEKQCKILNNDKDEFEHHSNIDLNVIFTLTVLGDGPALIVVGGNVEESTSITKKYTEQEGWVIEKPCPWNQFGSSAVSVHKWQLLTCAGIDNPTSCLIYDTDTKSWTDGPEMKASATFGQMLVLRHTGQRGLGVIWSFASSEATGTIRAVQTFDLSDGIKWSKKEWQLVPVEFQAKHSQFGVLLLEDEQVVLATDSAKIAYGDNFAMELYGDVVYKEMKLHDFTSNTIKTKPVDLAMQRHTYRSEFSGHKASLYVKSMKIRRRNQFIEGMFFKCGDENINQQQYSEATRFRCGRKQKGDTDPVDPIEFTGLEEIKEKYWSIESPDCNDGWCMGCDTLYDDASCPDVTESLDCSTDPLGCTAANAGHNSSTHSCHSIPALMNPNCDREDCVGHNWKTSIIYLYGDPTCDFEDVHFKMRMQILEENEDHNVTVSFHGEWDEEIFRIQVEFTECGTDSCMVKLLFMIMED